MASNIRYATTTDGRNVACWATGQGRPLVVMPWGPWAHIDVAQLPGCRDWSDRLAGSTLLVLFDSSGTGLSDRQAADFSIGARSRDLEAVVEYLELDQFALMGMVSSGPAGIAYAVANPGRVSHLILWCSFAVGRDFIESAYVEPFRALVERDWIVFTEARARHVLGWSNDEKARQLVTIMRESSSADTVKKAITDTYDVDVTALLPQVDTPTLVLQRRALQYPDLAVARVLASRIPKAQLSVVDGDLLLPFSEGMDAMVGAMEEFLATPGGPLTPTDHAEVARQHLRDPLGERELEVLRLIDAGLSNREICDTLFISLNTLRSHTRNLYRKLDVHSRTQAVSKAREQRLIGS